MGGYTPQEAMNFSHAPWWNYSKNTAFSPNPCACVASALIRYGTSSQKLLGLKIAKNCFNFLTSNEFCGDHDTLNIKTLVERLIEIKSPLINDKIIYSLKQRIKGNTCFDESKWVQYYFSPLDFVESPKSIWYDIVKNGIEKNINFWLDNINNEGVWEPNFSWGIDSEDSRQATQHWKGYVTVKRAKILKSFDRIEK